MSRLMIIPAAGTGSRLGASLPKVLVPVAGRPMLDHLLARYGQVVTDFVLVVSPDAHDLVATHVARRGERVAIAIQERPTGMLDAILAARDSVATSGANRIWITWCDQVAVRAGTVDALLRADAARPEPALAMPTCRSAHPYIHLRRDATGRIDAVLQRREGDVMPLEGESDMGLFSLSRGAFLTELDRYARAAGVGDATRERNFLPFIPWLAQNAPLVTFPCGHPMEAVGINTPAELASVEAFLRSSSHTPRTPAQQD
jgi:bifunctional UDP-N-acetylglucosamine pyrophosphorylase/glucosamine-1-phosphate N-acetyltransferase